MKILLLLPLLLGFSVPAIAHNEANGGIGGGGGFVLPPIGDQEVFDSGEGEEDGIGVESTQTHLLR